MTKKKWLYILMVPLVGVMIYFNYKVDTTARLSAPATSADPSSATSQEKPGNIAASDPKQFGIQKDDTNNTAKTQYEWTSEMDQTMGQPATEGTMAEQGILEDLKNNPQKIKERLERVEDEIRQQEVRVRQYPTDPDEKDRLQSLYMLKATITSLAEKVNAVP